jgi:hypothetical protein
MVSINGILEPLAGSVVQTALNAFMKRQGADDERTAPQRRADALTEICQRMLRTEHPPANGGHRPQVLVRVHADRCPSGCCGSDGNHGCGEGAGGDCGERAGARADVGWVGPVSAADTDQLLCDSELIRVVMRGSSEVLDVGRAQRTFPVAVRRALLAQWKTCFWEGCHQPAEWAEGHHIVPWEDGGQTSEANAALPCTHHHHVIHRDGWKLEKLPDGTIIARLGSKEMVCKPNAP